MLYKWNMHWVQYILLTSVLTTSVYNINSCHNDIEDVYQYKISVTKGTLRKVFHLETHTTVYKNFQIWKKKHLERIKKKRVCSFVCKNSLTDMYTMQLIKIHIYILCMLVISI